jgi:hypothetical protein
VCCENIQYLRESEIANVTTLMELLVEARYSGTNASQIMMAV